MSAESNDVVRSVLGAGLRGPDSDQAREALGVSSEADDSRFATLLVEEVARVANEAIDVTPARRTDPRPRGADKAVAALDPSFLGRLRTDGGGEGVLDVSSLDNPSTVLAVARAGTLRQRLAAIRRMAVLLDGRKLRGDDSRRLQEFLAAPRDVELAYEMAEARATLGGAIGREARTERDQLLKLSRTVAQDIVRFWDGQLAEEPIMALHSDQRPNLLVRLRDLPDLVAAHLGCLVEGQDEVLSRAQRLDLLASLRFSGDPRLVAPLVAVLKLRDVAFMSEASRALARIDDPRVQRALRRAYDRSPNERHKVLLAGALGLVGDSSGIDYVRIALGSDDPEVLRNALEALQSLGTTEDVDAVAPLLEHTDVSVQSQAVRALGRIGASRALSRLRQFRAETRRLRALYGELEEAEVALRARLELRGESEDTVALAPLRERDRLTEVGPSIPAPAGARLAAAWSYVIALFWMFVGARGRAVRRLELAASRHNAWILPLLTLGTVHARRERHAQALATFRRAVEVDRRRVEQLPLVMRALTTSFVRRAEEMEREGRGEIARGLLEEVMSLDLRKAPSAIRFEIHRRHDAMRRRGSA